MWDRNEAKNKSILFRTTEFVKYKEWRIEIEAFKRNGPQPYKLKIFLNIESKQ